MFNRNWNLFSSTLPRKSDVYRGRHARRPIRLHAERLEERMLMSVNSPGHAKDAPASHSTAAVVSAAIGSPSPVPGKSQSPAAAKIQIADDAADRFQSLDEFRAWLIQEAKSRWGDLFGKEATQPYFGGYVVFDGLQVFAASLDADDTSSHTNTQVDGVDEADLVETDGHCLYILSGQDLTIVRTGEGGDLEVMSRVHFDERPAGMYLSGDRLAIVSRSDWGGNYQFSEPWLMINAIDDVNFVGGIRPLAIDYAYAPITPHRPTTTVTVLDISDRADPAIVQKTELEGRLVSSRTVDGELRLVLSNDVNFPMPATKWVTDPIENTETPLPVDGVSDFRMGDYAWFPGISSGHSVYETEAEYLARFEKDFADTFRARIRSLAPDGSVISDTALFDGSDIYRPDKFSARSVTTIVTFDLDSDRLGPSAKASVLTDNASQVYATADAIYVFAQKNDYPAWGISNNAAATGVWKFAMSGQGGPIKLAAKGEFDGFLMDQFSADEYEGYLRVVSQTGNWANSGESVIVLKQVGKRLNVVGSVSGIAAGETLHSVRFLGSSVFFVTFRRIDPLFAVDLSDPTSPEVLGELHIPGYSEYLQPIDATHLLAIGRDTSDLGNGVTEPDSLQLSIFDVSDLTNPLLVDRFTFGGAYSTVTPATGSGFLPSNGGDHHAVSYFADEHILALPIHTMIGYSNWWGSNSTPLFDENHGGLQLFRIDVDAGFVPIGLVEHESLIERSVRIGDHLFAISGDTVSVHDLENPAAEFGEINFAATAALPIAQISVRPQTPSLSRIESIEQAVETFSGLSAASEIAPESLSVPQTGWVLPSLVNSRTTRPVLPNFSQRSTAFSGSRFDQNLLQLLASESTSTTDDFNNLGHGDSASPFEMEALNVSAFHDDTSSLHSGRDFHQASSRFEFTDALA